MTKWNEKVRVPLGAFSVELPAIVVKRRVSCKRNAVVKRVHPDRRGRFRVTVAAPPKQLAAVYRLGTRVRKHAKNRKTYPTFTLPRAVALR